MLQACVNKTKKIASRTVLTLLLLHSADAFGDENTFIYFDPHQLANLKAALTNNKVSLDTRSAFDLLISKANTALALKNESVVDKTIIPASGSKHDYLSISRYWWPSKNTKTGIPWVQRDGETNPDTQSDHVDRNRLERLAFAMRNLGLAYYLTGDEKYAKKASEKIETWFLDKDTYMKPNLKFAQSVPGRKPRKWGILDGRDIPVKVLDGVSMIKGSKHWNRSLDKSFNKWLKKYLKWLTKSSLGEQAAKIENNHGAWYHFHVIAVAYYLDELDTAKKFANKAKTLIGKQIDKHGKQTHELQRTRSYYYSTFNLDALTRIAIVSRKFGIDLWNYEAKDGASILTALDYLENYADGNVEWPYQNYGQQLLYLPPLFLRASNALNDGRYDKALAINFDKPSKFGKTTKNRNSYKLERFLFNAKL